MGKRMRYHKPAPVRRGREMPQTTQLAPNHYWPNCNYDHQGWLQKASGYTEPIDAVIQHGFDVEPDRVYPGEALAPCTTAWSWSELRDKAWAKHKPALPGCAPFLYAMDLYTPKPVEKREGTLFAPLHGTSGVVVEDSEYYYHLVKTLKDLPQPVTVSLYYQEFQDRDIVRKFEKHGYRVVCTVPDVNSDSAYKNQLDELARVAYHASNDICTQMFYATVLGIPSFLFGTPPVWTYAVDAGTSHLFEPTPEGRKVWAEAAEPFKDFSDVVTLQRMEMARYHLGVDRKMTPDDLKTAFEWAASLRYPK